MRYIHIDDGLRLHFPARSEDFDRGVEIGMLAVLMDQGSVEFTRKIARDNLPQVRVLAKQLGYRVIEGNSYEEWEKAAHGTEDTVSLTFRHGSAKPVLRLVHSAG